MQRLRRFVCGNVGITMEVFDEPDEEEERQISQYIDVVDSPRVSQNESEYQRSCTLSCSWDLNNYHNVYAGLQNGMVLVFDMRQNRGPLVSLADVTSNSVHILDGFHVCLKRRGDGSYSQKQSSTQAISTRELILQDPWSFAVSQRFALSSQLPLQDVKYANLNGSGLLGLLTNDRLQFLRSESP
ncbi:putative E3 ubiquitin-protein ligase RFWD3 [Arabidopsis thaliana]